MTSAGMARNLAAEISDIDIPEHLVADVERDRDAGVAEACEQILAIRDSGGVRRCAPGARQPLSAGRRATGTQTVNAGDGTGPVLCQPAPACSACARVWAIRQGSVPVWRVAPLKVSRSTMPASPSCVSVKVVVQANDSFEAIATPYFSKITLPTAPTPPRPAANQTRARTTDPDRGDDGEKERSSS